MARFNNRRFLKDSHKYALVLIGFLLIFQDVHIVHSETTAQNDGSVFLSGILQPTTIVREVFRGVGQTIQNLIPDPLRIQQKSTRAPTTITTTTKTTLSPNTTQPNLLTSILNMFQTKTSETTTAKTQIITTTAKPKPPDLFGGIFNIFTHVIDPLNIFTSRSKTEIKQKTTPIPASTKAPDLIGGIFGEVGKMLGLAPTTTTTTLYPPPRGGRGFSGLIFNILNIINDFFDLMRNAMLINEDWVPGYAVNKFKDMFESIKAEIQIFLQSDQPGGMGEILKTVIAIWNDLSKIFKAFTSGDPGGVITVPLQLAQTLQDITKLTNAFAIKFPTTTLPPGVKSRVNERNKINQEQSDKIMNHTETLVRSLLHIEEIVQKEFPNSIILKILGHFRASFTKAINDSKRYGKPFILTVIQAMFPNSLLAKFISGFGKILNQIPILNDFPLIKTISSLLNQEFFINVGLTIIQAFTNPFIGSIEKLFEGGITNAANNLLVLDPDHFILNIIDTLNDRFASLGKYLEQFQHLEGRMKLNFTEGDVFGQILNITLDVMSSDDVNDFVRETVAQVLKIIPFDFGQDIIHGITSVITDGITIVIRFFTRSLITIGSFSSKSTQSLNIVNVTTIKPTTH